MTKQHSYLRVGEVEPLPSLPRHQRLGVAIVADVKVPLERQTEIADWLYKSGCRYMAAWGVDCSTWDDALDWAQIDMWPEGAPDDQFVMTSWHENESLEEALWFIGSTARSYYDKILDHILILHIGDCDREDELKASFATASNT